MPRRSARIKTKIDSEQKEEVVVDKMELDSKPKRDKGQRKGKKTKTMEESVSNNKVSDDHQPPFHKAIKEAMEEKDPSEPSSIEPSRDINNPIEQLDIDQAKESMDEDDIAEDVEMIPAETEKSDQQQPDQEEDVDESMDDEPGATIAQTRSRRSVKPRISYKDDSSSEEEESDDSEDANNPLYAGLTKQQRKEMKAKMASIQNDYDESVKRERQLKIQEIIGSFDLNIGATVTESEAGFMYDFCRKHQYDIIEKIEDEGDFFLISMREMMEEKLKLIRQGILTNKSSKRRRNADDSESEFDMNDFEDSDDEDSEFSMGSDWDNPLIDNENLISDDEDDDYSYGRNRNRKRGKRRRNKNVWRDESGREYYAKGRLLLADALKDTENFEGWSAARVQAWKNKAVNPNAYYYRFNDPDDEPVNGPLREDEHKGFMQRVLEFGVNVHWGTFSMKIPGRVGYQCSNYWRQMMKDGWVKDPNYWIRSDGSFQFKRAKKGSIPDEIRKYSFVVVKDPSGVFGEDNRVHPKRPSDSKLARYLERDVRGLTEKEKKGGKRGGNGSKKKGGKKEDDETTDNKEEVDKEEVSETTDNKEVEVEEGGKKKKSKKKDKKKKSKKKKKGKKDKEEMDVDGNEDEEEEEEGGKKTKKKKKKSKKKKDKKSKKDKKDKKSKKKKSKKKKGEENEKGDENEKEGESETTEETAEDTAEENTSSGTTRKRGRKRKRNGDKGGEPSELEPPQKKRKIGDKNKENDDENEENEDPLSILKGMTDIMTGEALKNPAISPFGYVLEYNSWCSILRNPRTKNQCPFTKKEMTRRQLVKLDANNIHEYKDKIVNITEEDMENFKN